MYPDYVINGVPLIETVFDSDYWVWIDGLTFTTPLYNVLGFFSNNNYQSPIPVDNLAYTIKDMASIHPPLNIVGYQINPDQCLDCPGAKSLLGTYSKYTYEPQKPQTHPCLLYTSPSPRDRQKSRMPSSA